MQSLTAYENDSDPKANQFVESYLPLVKKIAVSIKRKLPSHIEFDDLLQSGLIGLIEAKNNFKSDMGASFETFASIRIKGAIIDYLRKNSWVSRETIKAMKEIAAAVTKIEQRDLRHATVEDILTEMNITSDEYFRISQEISILQIISLTERHIDSVTNDDSDDPEKIFQQEGIKQNLKDILKTLPEREQLILSLYYVDELTFKQIGEVLELTEARICQLHGQAITRVRRKFNFE